uniref:Uncharacterized protein n=1 Tax=Micrurus lemniscatus lemniscatus TaxID=129467 RepID=A0A2D4JGK7_MICLE
MFRLPLQGRFFPPFPNEENITKYNLSIFSPQQDLEGRKPLCSVQLHGSFFMLSPLSPLPGQLQGGQFHLLNGMHSKPMAVFNPQKFPSTRGVRKQPRDFQLERKGVMAS